MRKRILCLFLAFMLLLPAGTVLAADEACWP